jgi:hypothetical protein
MLLICMFFGTVDHLLKSRLLVPVSRSRFAANLPGEVQVVVGVREADEKLAFGGRNRSPSYDFSEGPRTSQSARSVTVGSTRAARRDGSQLATSATAASSAATPTNVTGSLALTS